MVGMTALWTAIACLLLKYFYLILLDQGLLSLDDVQRVREEAPF